MGRKSLSLELPKEICVFIDAVGPANRKREEDIHMVAEPPIVDSVHVYLRYWPRSLSFRSA